LIRPTSLSNRWTNEPSQPLLDRSLICCGSAFAYRPDGSFIALIEEGKRMRNSLEGLTKK
jgi:hypothetical protein